MGCGWSDPKARFARCEVFRRQLNNIRAKCLLYCSVQSKIYQLFLYVACASWIAPPKPQMLTLIQIWKPTRNLGADCQRKSSEFINKRQIWKSINMDVVHWLSVKKEDKSWELERCELSKSPKVLVKLFWSFSSYGCRLQAEPYKSSCLLCVECLFMGVWLWGKS